MDNTRSKWQYLEWHQEALAAWRTEGRSDAVLADSHHTTVYRYYSGLRLRINSPVLSEHMTFKRRKNDMMTRRLATDIRFSFCAFHYHSSTDDSIENTKGRSTHAQKCPLLH